MTESLNRRVAITQHEARYKGVTWCKKKVGRCQVFWPIYDFTNDDIWTAIARNHWAYNRVYDLQYQWGLAKEAMRVSALIHETAWHSIEMLQEFEPETYNRFIRRVSGVGTFAHTFDSGDIIPRQLPFAFASWLEYRDYLLVHIVIRPGTSGIACTSKRSCLTISTAQTTLTPAPASGFAPKCRCIAREMPSSLSSTWGQSHDCRSTHLQRRVDSR